MEEKIKEYILEGNYHLAECICEKMNLSEVRDMLFMLAYHTEKIYVYSFIQYMISKTNSPLWSELAFDVMLHALCFIEGAYSVALFHARELLELEYNAINLERILFFYDIPEKLIKKNEAESIAKELLNIEPDDKVALRILGNH